MKKICIILLAVILAGGVFGQFAQVHASAVDTVSQVDESETNNETVIEDTTQIETPQATAIRASNLYAELPVSDPGLISIGDVAISGLSTGTIPFDSLDNQGPGYDNSADDTIVRSFDQVKHILEFAYKSKDANMYSGGSVMIEGQLPKDDNGKVIATWTQSTFPAAYTEFSADGTHFILTLNQIDQKELITGMSILQPVTFDVLGAKNGQTIQASYQIYPKDNTIADDAQSITMAPVTVSARPAFDIKIESNEVTYTPQIVTYNGQQGRVVSYALQASLLNNKTPTAGLRGTEVMSGPINFDIDLGATALNTSTHKSTVLPNANGSVLYDYALNGAKLTGNMNGRTAYAAKMAYGKSSLAGSRQNATVNDSGTVAITQAAGSSQLAVSISDYVIDGKFPTHYYPNSSEKTKDYAANEGAFATVVLYVFVPFYDELGGNYQINTTATAENINGKTVSDAIVNDSNEEKTTNNTGTAKFMQGANGTISVRSIYSDINASDYLGTDVSSGDGSATRGQEITIRYKATVNGDPATGGANMVMKFDGEALTIKPYNASEEIIRYNDNNTPHTQTWKYRFGVLPTGQNWTSDAAMNLSTGSELTWYTSISEAQTHGIVVAIEVNTTSQVIDGGYSFIARFDVNDEAVIHKTYQTIAYGELYTDVNHANRFAKSYEPSESRYSKTLYDANGNISTQPFPIIAGDTMVIVPWQVSVEKTVVEQSNNKPMTNYDLNYNNSVTWKLTPSLKTYDAKQNGVQAQVVVTDTLPAGLSYINGSASKDPNTVERNENGTTTITWVYDQFTVNTVGTPITYKTDIDLTTKNGTNYINNAVATTADDFSALKWRQAKYTVIITNNLGWAVNKEALTPIVEESGLAGSDLVFKLSYLNNSTGDFNDVQLIDVLPYLGDARGSSFNGSYTIKSITFTNDVSYAETTTTTGLKIDANPHTDPDVIAASWIPFESGAKATAVLIHIGDLKAGERGEVIVTLEPIGNQANDVYVNNFTGASATGAGKIATFSRSAIETVVGRSISGQIWVDTLADGLKDTNTEPLFAGKTVYLLDEKNQPITDENGVAITTVTKADGTYTFNHLLANNYKIALAIDNQKYENTDYEIDGSTTSNDNNAKEFVTIDGKSALITETVNLPESTGKTNSYAVENLDFGVVPLIEINKTVNDTTNNTATHGETLTYKIIVTNLAEDESHTKHVTIKDTVPAGTTLITDSINSNGTATADELSWVFEVAGNSDSEASFSVSIDDFAEESKTIPNTASVNNINTNEVTTIVLQPLAITTDNNFTDNNSSANNSADNTNPSLPVTGENILPTLAGGMLILGSALVLFKRKNK